MKQQIETLKAEIAERQDKLKELEASQENEGQRTELSDAEIDEIINTATR